MSLTDLIYVRKLAHSCSRTFALARTLKLRKYYATKMHSTYSFTALALASLTAAQTTHMVQVGPGLKYSPNTLMNVKEGDTVNVMFNNVEHNIVSGDFDNPCQYDDDDGGLYSGVLMEKTFSFKVNSTDPAVYYCSVGMHCQAGA